MLLARVIGDCVSTIKETCYAGLKMMWVQPVDLEGQPKGDAFVTFDVVDAGPGELVLVLQEGGGAMQVTGVPRPSPVGTAIVAVVDEVRLRTDSSASKESSGGSSSRAGKEGEGT